MTALARSVGRSPVANIQITNFWSPAASSSHTHGMTNLKIAIEVEERDGRMREAGPDATVHAYDVEAGRFPYHQGLRVPYIVKPDIGWGVTLQQRRPVCSDCKNRHEHAA